MPRVSLDTRESYDAQSYCAAETSRGGPRDRGPARGSAWTGPLLYLSSRRPTPRAVPL